MRMIPVTSSNLKAVGYDSDTKTLRVEFHNGTYDHYDVPEAVYRGLLDASSKGRYYHYTIRDRFQYVRVS